MNRLYSTSGALVMALLASVTTLSCNRKTCEPDKETVFILEASLEEEGLERAPGDAVHLKGTGYRQTDNVMLTFCWETGDIHFPLGKASGIYAKRPEVTPEGITAALPYRYPAADVEVSVMREGNLQQIGKLRITDGQSPKELRLYGKSNTLKNIEGFILDENNVGRKSLEVALPENFHSIINVPRSYGLCGISGNAENRTAVYVDFFTGEAETLATDVVALFTTPAKTAHAIVCRDGICTLVALPIETGADYMTKSSSPAPVQPTLSLPEGLKPEYFGDYPGVFIGTVGFSSYLLSANRGNGNWTTVILDKDGFRKVEDIEAAAVIPFRVANGTTADDKAGDNTIGDSTAGDETVGYIVTYDGGPSLFRPVNAETGEMGQAIYTCKMGRIVSATSHPGKPDHILLNFAEPVGGARIYDLDWRNLKTLSPIALTNSENDYAEVLMAN